MLFLLFQLGNDRYALEAHRVVEVVPLLSLKKIPQSPPGVAGLFVYRGQAIPALDLCAVTLGRPARERLSTRIIVVEYGDSAVERPGPGVESRRPPPTRDARPPTQLLGLIAERATEMMRRDARDFVDAGARPASAPFLGPVLIDERGVIQLLHAQKLLAENVRGLVFKASDEWRVASEENRGSDGSAREIASAGPGAETATSISRAEPSRHPSLITPDSSEASHATD